MARKKSDQWHEDMSVKNNLWDTSLKSGMFIITHLYECCDFQINLLSPSRPLEQVCSNNPSQECETKLIFRLKSNGKEDESECFQNNNALYEGGGEV